VEVRIRPAEPREGERLREIAAASKQYWGYERERVGQWAATLDYSGKEVHVAEAGGEAVAYAVLGGSGETAILDELWVEPEWIGKGVGSRLFQFVAGRAAERGASRLEWESDPNAVGFYERLGARYVRDSEPSEWGRILPVMGIEL